MTKRVFGGLGWVRRPAVELVVGIAVVLRRARNSTMRPPHIMWMVCALVWSCGVLGALAAHPSTAGGTVYERLAKYLIGCVALLLAGRALASVRRLGREEMTRAHFQRNVGTRPGWPRQILQEGKNEDADNC